MGDTSRTQSLTGKGGDVLRSRVHGGVQLVVAVLQGRQSGGNGDRVAGKCAGLIDRPEWCELTHHIRAATKCGRGQPPAHHLAEGQQVRRPTFGHRLNPVPTRTGNTEPCHHFIEDQQRAVLSTKSRELCVESGSRRNNAHVGGDRLGDHTGNLRSEFRECLLHRFEVVVRQDDGVPGRCGSNSGGIRQRESGDARSSGGEQGIPMAVVTTGELDDLRPAGESAREPNCRHRGLSPGTDQSNLLNRVNPRHNFLGQQDLARAWCAEGQPVGGSVGD